MEDLIKRDDAIRVASGYCHPANVAKELAKLPSAQPERKTGRWIRHAIGHENTPWGFDCSVCNKWFVIGEDTANQYNYCPNCGAKMEDGK